MPQAPEGGTQTHVHRRGHRQIYTPTVGDLPPERFVYFVSGGELHGKRIFHEAPLLRGGKRPDIVLTRALESAPTELGALFVLELRAAATRDEAQPQLERYLASMTTAHLGELAESSVPASAIGGLTCAGALSTATEIMFMIAHMVMKGAFWTAEVYTTMWLSLLLRSKLKPRKHTAGLGLAKLISIYLLYNEIINYYDENALEHVGLCSLSSSLLY